jgi:hypothetical protein
MTYDVEVYRGLEPPVPEHDDTFYHHVEEVKVKGRRKKNDPREFKITRVLWEDLNQTELMRLCYYNRATDIGDELAICRVLCRTLAREVLISIIKGEQDVTELSTSPVHRARDAIVTWQHQNWVYIYSQIRCNLDCAGCSDICVTACYVENEHQFQER